MEIVRLTTFDRSARKSGISESNIAKLIEALLLNPQAGEVIQGTGGLRKIRFAAGGKGKRGGARAIYVLVQTKDTIFLIAAYRKARQEDLTDSQKAKFIALLERLK